MNIELLRDFLCVSESMSLTRAAELRNTTQSNLSKRLRALEMWLGRDLIDRRGRPLALTQAGEDFVPKARGILAELDGFRGAAISWNVADGAVSIAMPHSATVSLFPAFKKRLLPRLPKASFAPRIANHDMVARMLSRSECDLALVTRHPRVPQADEFAVFRSVEIARDRLVLVAPPGTREGEALPLHVSDARTYIGQIWQVCRVAVSTTREIEHGMAADIRAHCLAGDGRGVLPETMVEADIASGRLVVCDCTSDLGYEVSLFCAPKASPQAKRIWALASDI
jgi:DNA-binding transcriptional LysR family regulator